MFSRFLLGIFICIMFAFSSYAQSTVDIGQSDEVSAPEQMNADSPKSNDGVFSFLNFSFLNKKNPEILKESENRRETFLQTVTRKAEEGNVDAQLSLGYMYLYGDAEAGVTPDYKRAFDYYSMAAAQGDNVAINNLGSLYYNGVGTKKNPYKAATLFTKATDLGNVEAAVNLAFLYLSGSGVAQDNIKAMNYFAKSSSKGNLTAQYMMGYAYYRGFVVPQDYKKAFEMMREPAKAGYDDAQYSMALMYLNGEGITKNYGNSVKYLGNAFMQGNVDAMIKLADILAAGEVYPKNIYQAHVLYNIASVRGANDAAQKRDGLEKNLKIDEVLQAQTEAEKFKDAPKEITNYIRKTFGGNIRHYIDDLMPAPKTQQQMNRLPPLPALPSAAPETDSGSVPMSRRLL